MYGQRYWVLSKKTVELTLNSQAAWVTLRSSYNLIGEKGEVQHVILVTSLLETNCNLCDPFKYVKIEMKRLRWQDGDAVDGFGHFNHQNPLFFQRMPIQTRTIFEFIYALTCMLMKNIHLQDSVECYRTNVAEILYLREIQLFCSKIFALDLL